MEMISWFSFFSYIRMIVCKNQWWILTLLAFWDWCYLVVVYFSFDILNCFLELFFMSSLFLLFSINVLLAWRRKKKALPASIVFSMIWNSLKELELICFLWVWWGFLIGSVVKNLPTKQETRVRSLRQEDHLEKEMQPIPVFLSGKSHGQRNLVGYSPCSQKSWTWLSDRTTAAQRLVGICYQIV